MTNTPSPHNEPARLEVLRMSPEPYAHLEQRWQETAELASELCDSPLTAIFLVEGARQTIKAGFGFAFRQLHLGGTFSAHVVATGEYLEVPDASTDVRFPVGELIGGAPAVRFFAGIPLKVGTAVVGALCVMDTKPRSLTDEQRRGLRVLARHLAAVLGTRGVSSTNPAEQLPFFGHAADGAVGFETLFDLAVELMCIGDFEGWFRKVNRSFTRTLGYTEAELLARPYIDFVHPEDRAATATQVERLARGERVEYFELRGIAQDGSVKYLAFTGAPLPGKGLFCAIARDVTEKKAAEDALRESEERFRQIADNIGEVFWVADSATGRLSYVSPGCTGVSGLSPEELRAKPHGWVGSIHPADRKRLLASRQQLSDSGREDEYRIVRPDGTVRWIVDRAFPIRDAAGKVYRLGGVARDITARRAAEEALQQSRRGLLTLMSNLPGMVYRCRNDKTWTIEFVSEGAMRLTGYSAQELIDGKHVTFAQLIHEEDRERVWEQVQHAINGRRQFEIVYRLVCRDGSEKWVWERGQAVLDGEEQPCTIEGFITDITAQRIANEAVRLSEERFRLLSRATNDAIWDWSPQTDAVVWNEGYATLFGYENEVGVPQPMATWKLRIHPEDSARVRETLLCMLAGHGDSWSAEYRYRRADGSYAWVMNRGYVIRDSSGKAIRMIGGMTDVTQRREAEERIAEQAALIDEARDAIVVRDLENRVQFWSKGAERLYGWSAAEVRGKVITHLLQMEEAVVERAQMAVRETGAWSGQLCKVTRSGESVTVDGSWTLLRDSAGKPKSILSIDTDITERQKLESQFLRAQRLESLGTLAGGIAHDLNNVLSPILMAIQVLESQSTNEGREILDILEKSAERGAGLVRQVLSFARGMEGKRVAIDPSHSLREVERIVRDTFPKSIEVETHVPAGLPTMMGDPTQLDQVLMNLAVNARDAMPHGGTLRMTLSDHQVTASEADRIAEAKPGRYLMIEVADNGIGMEPEILDKIFEPFFTTKEIGQGTGLGLSTSLAIVRSHGGFVTVDSKLGMGTRFRVFFPALEQPSVTKRKVSSSDLLPRGMGETILVVDDELSVRMVATKTLERFGYRVLQASNGLEAVRTYADRREEIAAVLTDMDMPVMGGAETIANLREMNPCLRIITSSGLTSRPLSLGESAPAYFLAKPYTAESLLSTVRKVLLEAEAVPLPCEQGVS
jgi:PAS domain S-box-containing protein